MRDRRPSSASNLQNTKQIYKPLSAPGRTNLPPPANLSICRVLTKTLVSKKTNQTKKKNVQLRLQPIGQGSTAMAGPVCTAPCRSPASVLGPQTPVASAPTLPVHCTGNQLPRQPQSPAACLSVKTNFVLHVTRNLMHPSVKEFICTAARSNLMLQLSTLQATEKK